MPFSLTLSGDPFAAVYAIAFLLSLFARENSWSVARAFTRIALAVAILQPLLMLLTAVPVSLLSTTMSLLIALLGWVIVDYASRYLEGDQGQPRFVRAMLFTLFSVALLVNTNNLLLMVVAWSASSVSLHLLLTHYRERKAARIVAHKKFLVSRMADVCLIAALVLVYYAFQSFSLTDINQQLSELTSLSPTLHAAAVLFAVAAILKTAQLPLHGWLIQVMEAPTPVSALLHAGVVNMGGFVLISLAALISQAPWAQALLVAVGSTTVVLAGWVMMTRISIKVRLAWSTCAQMGFMLVEIGLGLYELALLHLIAHSVYKAYSFLNAGEVVKQTIDKESMTRPASFKGVFLSVAACAMLITTILMVWQHWVPSISLPLPATLVLILGFSPLLWHAERWALSRMALGLGRVGLLFHLYLLWHSLFAHIAPPATPVHPALMVFVCAALLLLYSGQVAISRFPHSKVVQTLYPWAYNGFYLDETFTRLTFKVWPAKLSVEPSQTQVNHQKNTFGELA